MGIDMQQKAVTPHGSPPDANTPQTDTDGERKSGTVTVSDPIATRT